MNSVAAASNLGVFGKLPPNSGGGLTPRVVWAATLDLFLREECTEPFLNECSEYMLNKHSGGRLQLDGSILLYLKPTVRRTGERALSSRRSRAAGPYSGHSPSRRAA
jgi:hypothetical protein